MKTFEVGSSYTEFVLDGEVSLADARQGKTATPCVDSNPFTSGFGYSNP